MYDLALPGGGLHGINTADPRIVVFGGGFPLFIHGRLAGGIGISGGTVPEDEQMAGRLSLNLRNYSTKEYGGEYDQHIK